jgi:hypothetical protein
MTLMMKTNEASQAGGYSGVARLDQHPGGAGGRLELPRENSALSAEQEFPSA